MVGPDIAPGAAAAAFIARVLLLLEPQGEFAFTVTFPVTLPDTETVMTGLVVVKTGALIPEGNVHV